MDTATAGGGSVVVILLGLVGWVVRWKLTRDAAREDLEVAARIKRDDRHAEEREKREERVVAAAEAQARATSDQAVALTEMAAAMSQVATKVDHLAGVVQGMRDDLDEITDAQSPDGKRKRRVALGDGTLDGVEPPKHQPVAGGFRAPTRGGRDG